ncbi:hypothetical protein [Palaeococcus sp. (in: euryarchaeotes)]|uniref:hypothetical protein n=1 Tax=Palaeococcus sp. (in: euryarchaeotes) TaxID=2820298 RepID=UPI0025FE3D48|nr:hypothetical protein [Palaeococcus sp. (in: euryarchaeotes)]MCD6559785.1 hypothetical protein [Palaeococcus sp. (in: euryarchaeotes)]
MNVNNKITIMTYALGSVAGVLSGLAGKNVMAGAVLGIVVYMIMPKIILNVIKELPDEMSEERLIWKRSLWSFLLFWFYFWVLTYNLVVGFEPKFYNPEKSLLYQMIQNMTG